MATNNTQPPSDAPASGAGEGAVALANRLWNEFYDRKVDPKNTLRELIAAIRVLAAAPKPASDTALPNSWANTPEAKCEQAMLLAEVELHLQQCRVFITSREKMHPCGVDLHDELQIKVTAALDAIGREKAHG